MDRGFELGLSEKDHQSSRVNERRDTQTTLIGVPVTLTVRLLGTEAKEPEPDHMQPDEAPCCASGERLPELASTQATTICGCLTRDYHLRSDSPAIDAGCDQHYAPDDYTEGDSRPQKARYDIGADEHRSSFTYLPLVMRNASTR
jgi:hypothetical protein